MPGKSPKEREWPCVLVPWKPLEWTPRKKGQKWPPEIELQIGGSLKKGTFGLGKPLVRRKKIGLGNAPPKEFESRPKGKKRG